MRQDCDTRGPPPSRPQHGFSRAYQLVSLLLLGEDRAKRGFITIAVSWEIVLGPGKTASKHHTITREGSLCMGQLSELDS